MSYPAALPEEERKARQRAATAKSVAKYKNDPEWRANKKAISRRWYVAHRNDPVHRAQCRARYAKYYAKHEAVLAKLTIKEHVVEKYLCDAIEARGGFCPKFNDVGRRGAPDRLVILPGQPVYFVELKRPHKGKLASWQKRYHEQLLACGQKVWVLNSIEMVDDFLLTL